MTISEARERLRVRMLAWPRVDERTRAYLADLHWRRRRVVELVYGERLTVCQAAAQLGHPSARWRAICAWRCGSTGAVSIHDN